MLRSAKIIDPENADAAFAAFGRLYPWASWFDGQARVLTLKEHFPTIKNVEVAVRYCRLVARRQGVRLRIRRNTASQEILLQRIPMQYASAEGSRHYASHKDVEIEGTSNRLAIRNKSPGSKRRK